MKKKILMIALTCLTLFMCSMSSGLSCVNVYADEADSYSFDMTASTTEAKLNETFDISISIEKKSSSDKFTMYAAEYTLMYDPTFFTLTSHPQLDKEDGRGVTYMVKENADQNGRTAFTVSILSPNFEGLEWDNPSKLVTLTFRADKIGAAAIKCQRAAMGTIFGGNLDCSTNDVIVTVVNNKDDSSSDGTNDGKNDDKNPSNGGDNGETTTPENPDNSTDPSTDQDKTPGTNDDTQNGSLVFDDVKDSDWFSSAVKYVTEKGLFNGTGNGMFSPQGGMNRAMLVTVLWRLDGSSAVTGGTDFADVSSDQWYATAVKWASQNGIVNGVTADSFAPMSYVTREQIAAMIYRYAQYKGEDVSSTETLRAYSDAAFVSEWAQPAVKWAVGRGVISGMTDGTISMIRPGNTATRAQVATMLMRFAG